MSTLDDIAGTPGTPIAAVAPPGAGNRRHSDRRELIGLLLRSPSFVIGMLVIFFWTVCGIFGDRITPYRHDEIVVQGGNLLDPNFRPSWDHPFGLDTLGRDVLSRVLTGAGPILAVAPLATLIGIVSGSVLGLITGYFGGTVDNMVSRLIDAVLALPLIIIAVGVLQSTGTSSLSLAIVIGFVFTPIVARTVRSAVLGERHLDYVQAAKLRGERAPYIMFVEILPNVVPPIVVEATVRLGYAIFTVQGITFLGLGLQPPTPDWSVDITAGFQLLNDTAHNGYYWQVLFPGLAIVSICVAVSMLADNLQQVFDR
jgi:ABC-type dipeptide/oligopeptide/nickel transport systems, permease components